MLLLSARFRCVPCGCVLLWVIALIMASGCDSKPTVEDTRPVEHSWAIQQYLDGDEVTPIERELMEKLIAEGRTEFEPGEYGEVYFEAKRIEREREQESATKPKQKDDW